MNIQDAYKKLDLAKGLNEDRVKDQYRQLKTEIESKISSTQNDRLKQVYTNRLAEVEEAYGFLIDHFNNDGGNSATISNSEQTKPVIENVSVVSKSKPNNKKIVIISSMVLGLALIGVLFFLNIGGNEPIEEIDLFRKIEGEKQVFVNNLTLRQYPDSKSSKIEVFPIGTRLFFEENELPKTDDKQRVWRKVRVIHPVYGWERPDERFPYPYEGWMAVEECGVPWVEDSLTTANLLRILGNDDAGRSITSSYRHGLVEFFQQNNYFGEWIIYGSDKKDKMQKVMLTNLGNSEDDCNGDDQLDFVVLMINQNNGNQKLIIMSSDARGNTMIVYEEDGYDSDDQLMLINDLRVLKSSELRRFNKQFNTDAKNAIFIRRGVDEQILFMRNGRIISYDVYLWNE
jgi:hypothetical protein